MLTPLETLQLYESHDGTIAGVLASRARTDQSRPFLLFEDVAWTWGELQDFSISASRMLVSRGIGKGDRVAIMSTNSDLFVALFTAIARIGAIMVPVNPDFTAGEAAYVLKHAGVSAVACTPATLKVARAAAREVAPVPWLMLLDGAAEGLPNLRDLAAAAPETPLPADITAEDTCLIVYTSGTTGFPKGAMHSQRALVLTGEGFVERLRLQPTDRLLCILPLFHINAIFYSLCGALAAGASLVLTPRFSASGFWPLIKKSGATQVNIIAAVGSILARRPRSELVPGHGLQKLYGSGTPEDVYKVFETEFGVTQLVEGYGMTEVPGACNTSIVDGRRAGSMGKAARHPDPDMPFAELRVVDDDGNDVAPGVVGELIVRIPTVMQGYYRDPEQTAAAFRDGWFLTGDLVRRDDDGFHYFVSRKKDIIRRRGENVSGAEIDRIVGQHPGVAEAAALAVPSDLGEDEILVAVIAASGASPAASEIAAWCAQRLAPAKVPRYIAYVESLPHTPTHRVAKYQLDKAALLAAAIDLQAPAPKAT
ncbi:MAG: AMP-binding protein [Dehalococcoidia bacterium]|nr:AMP-binding protein [Dehalococcoidia bacterium]